MLLLLRILAASILLLALMSFFYARSERFSKIGRWLILLLSVLLIAFVVAYEVMQENQSEKNRELLSAFLQGKTLICKEYEVTQDRFNFTGGTKVFNGKEHIQELQGVIVSIEECGLK